MSEQDYTGKIVAGFNVIGEASGKLLFTIPVEERGTSDSDRVSVGDRIRLQYGEGYISFERIRE